WLQPLVAHADRRHRDSLRKARQQQIIQCITNAKQFDVYRGLEELAAARLDPTILREFVASLGKYRGEKSDFDRRLVNVLVAAGPDAVPVIVSAMKADNSLNRAVFLPALAWIGPDARKALPFLRERLRARAISRDDACALRMTIAHIEGNYREVA